MSGKIVAEDVPAILSALSNGRSKNSLAREYGVSPGMIRHVEAGWVPRSRAEIEELRERQRIQQERGLVVWPKAKLPKNVASARNAAFDAIHSGRLVRGACFCGETRVEAHHANGYEREHWLDVVWLCNRHHKDEHNRLRAAMPPPEHSIRRAKVDPLVPSRVPSGKSKAELAREYRVRKKLRDATPQRQAQPGVAAGLRAAAESMAGIAGTDVVRDESGAITSLRLTGVSVARPRPSFLAAPDDDCGACGHDRQQYHLPAELPCRGPAPYARGGVCRCPAFVDSAAPF